MLNQLLSITGFGVQEKCIGKCYFPYVFRQVLLGRGVIAEADADALHERIRAEVAAAAEAAAQAPWPGAADAAMAADFV